MDDANRQLEAEKKKAEKGRVTEVQKGKRDEAIKGLTKTKQDEERKRKVLEQYLKETFDG